MGYDALQKKFETSKIAIEKKDIRENLKPIIQKAINESNDIKQFKKVLLASNINPILRVNEQGRLYEVSFIDYQNKTILNGSRLGKEFSANALNELFSHESTADKSQDVNRSQYEQIEVNKSIDSQSDFSIGISLFEQRGVDLENEKFVKKKVAETKRKKTNRRI